MGIRQRFERVHWRSWEILHTAHGHSATGDRVHLERENIGYALEKVTQDKNNWVDKITNSIFYPLDLVADKDN